MPIHFDNPKVIDVILEFGEKYPPNWKNLWNISLNKYYESLEIIQNLFARA